MQQRSTREVFEDHLELASRHDFETDLRNYADDCVILTGFGVFHGHEGVRQAAIILEKDAPKATYTYTLKLDAGEMSYLEWTAEGDGVRIEDGADSFLIRDGEVQVQTIHYRVVPNR